VKDPLVVQEKGVCCRTSQSVLDTISNYQQLEENGKLKVEVYTFAVLMQLLNNTLYKLFCTFLRGCKLPELEKLILNPDVNERNQP
jgi:hypothetical protein